MAPQACLWSAAPAELSLQEGEVHVWRAALDGQPGRPLAQTLSAGEQERAARFHFEADRRRFVAGRGFLRAVLARYLRIEPGEVRFSYGEQGKPTLPGDAGEGAIHFNLAHSGELALCAVARREVGIDLELIRPVSESAQIADRYFSMRERAAFHSRPLEEAGEGFLRQWTRKEAYLKARGCGLSLEPDRVEVWGGQDGPLKLEVAGEPGEATRWSLVDLTPGGGYVAALAVEGRDWSLSCWQWAG
ncbi:MAG TPA: 4'-phosphopantetheinyl transferase superfamily protein [Chloroflexia bacterium]